MIVYLWTANDHSGVTDSSEAARHAAGAYITRREADTATVEQARYLLNAASLTDTYRKTGTVWRGRPCGGEVRWIEVVPGRVAS